MVERARLTEEMEDQGKVGGSLRVRDHPCFEEAIEVWRLKKTSRAQRPDRPNVLLPC